MKNIFFNSSMPRACSTLLQNILNQNPTIHATPTDGSLELLYGARVNFTDSPEFKAQDSELMLKAWQGFCYGGLQGYADKLTNKQNVCIKNRGIGVHYNWFQSFFDRPVKVITMVRNLKSIFSSLEKIFRSSSNYHTPIQNHSLLQGTTTQKRVEIWAQSPPVGLALERLHQCILENTIQNMLIIKAEDLWSSPNDVLTSIYKYLELPVYLKHDFNNVEQTTQEDDDVFGVSGLHTIKQKVAPVNNDFEEILGTSTCRWIDHHFDWYQKSLGY